jgi:outer membrane lipoprotein carrier protein
MTLFALRSLAVGALTLAMACSVSAQDLSSGMVSLERFVRDTRSGRASFTQVVTAPARDGQLAKSKTSSGIFEFSRPNRFRFFYQKPFEQTIVADGQTLWLHDVDLNQVTARKLSQVMGGTPAALIAAAPNLQALQADFSLRAMPDKDVLQWVQATPKTRDGQLQSISIGFRNAGKTSELAVLEIIDSFGQRSVMRFAGFEANPAFNAAHFDFKPPPGADVIRP